MALRTSAEGGEPDELEAALAAVERPQAHLIEVRDEPLIARIYAMPALHRMLPAAVAVKLAEWWGRLDWRFSATLRREALDRAAAVLDMPADSEQARRFARRDLAERRALLVLFWRPWVKRRTRIEGLGNLAAARAGGRGVILVSAHVGPLGGLILALASRGYKLYIGRYRRVEEDRVRRGRWARATRMSQGWIEDAGCRWVGRGGSYQVFGALLARGEVCLMTFDIPGSTPAMLAGRRFLVTSGIASLARETDSLLVPGFAAREGHRIVARLLPPIEPAEFASTQELHEHLAEIVGEAMFARPEQSSPQIARLRAHAESAPPGKGA